MAVTAVVAGTSGVLAPTALADVRDGRAIEIFHGRNIVGLDGYPPNTSVKTQVFRGDREIGFATLTTDSTGFVEINHVGGTDCWQSQYTPDIRPGDIVRTTVGSETRQDFSVTRDVFIKQDAEFLPGNIIRVTGHAKSTTGAPIAGGDAVELRMNKVSRTNMWETSDPPGRRDLRLEDVRPFLLTDGTYTYDFAVSADDWNDARTTGIDISTVWLHGVTETAEATELTFYDGEPEPTEGCPKTVNDFDAPSVPGNVQAIPVGTDGTRITWAEATDDVAVTGYTVYRNGVEVGATRVTATNKGLLFNDGPLPDGVYNYTVTANDATPNHSRQSAAGSVTVGGPAAPTGVSAAAGDGLATVSWTAPTSTGSGPITGYKVRVFQNGTEVGAARNATASPFQVTGLTNGSPYTFRVAATNSVGTGVYSSPTNAVTPAPPTTATAPAAPAAPAATAGNGQATVSWTAPADGGSAITGYTVRAYAGTSTTPASSTPASGTSVVVPNLTNGTSYTFDVVATNGVGSSPASARSNAVTPRAPATVPGAPTNATATAGNASATVSWTAPASNGGSGIIRYDVRVYTGTATTPSRTVAGTTATSHTVTGLTNGTSYRFDVRAVNAVGSSTPSGLTTAVTPRAPATVPGAPTNATATAGNGSATVSWTAPASNGGSAITRYDVRVYTGTATTPSRTVAGTTATRHTVTGLTNGTSYRFDVRAVNAVGSSTASALTTAVTPRATVPTAPIIGTAVAGATAGGAITATANWTAPTSNGGSAITGYVVRALRMSSTGTVLSTTTSAVQPGTARSLTMTNLPAAGNYRFTVQARNAIGSSVQSARSNLVAGR